MKNIHIIPTDKTSVLILRQDGKLFFTGYGGQLGKVHGLIKDVPQHIYITNSEEIKEGDWYFDVTLEQIIKANVNSDHNVYIGSCKKIILTTDLDLIKDGVQGIDDEFLEWFVNNPSCEFVVVKQKQHFEADKSKRINPLNGVYYSYKIIVPQEEPKYITVKEPCSLCDGTGEKNRNESCNSTRKCDLCNGEKYWNKKILVEEPKQYTSEELEGFEDFKKLIKPKQETLEEAAKEFYPPATTDLICAPKLVRDAFIAGAKWQSERMYSEEEVYNILVEHTIELFKGQPCMLDEFFEKFKKK